MSIDWPAKPFDPSDTTRVPVDDATIAAIQKVLIGWDGTNWEAVRAVLRRDGLDESVIKAMDTFAIRMHFAVGSKTIVARIGGQASTTVGTITAAYVPEPLKPAAYTVAAETRIEWLARAMVMVREHPEWSDAQIARSVGKSPGTLSRSDEYQTAARLARGGKTDRPKGHRTVDPDTGSAGVEAVAPPTASADDRSDRGKPICGSRYVREYCAQCGEPMKVAPDKVGTNPLCDCCAE